MSNDDMLGRVVRSLMGVPGSELGMLLSVMERLSGERREYWRNVYIKAHRGENPFLVRGVDPSTLKLLPEAAATIPRRGKRAGNPFCLTAEDPESPFGARWYHDGVSPGGEGSSTKRRRVQGHLVVGSLILAQLLDAAGEEEEVRRRHLFTRSQIRHLVDRQSAGNAGPLSTTRGERNRFFMLDEDGSVGVVSVAWNNPREHWELEFLSGSQESGDFKFQGGRLFLQAD